eukprot:CAMPEP_0203951578 /NCGR_PEP_ID=MMETSP0359-20131031/85431_1 /ASSEMBLY_ACC=CAM_ASM_000338 /TAXON_ID=268821 /ORGANISM="Scrippsiella Hangoei, Strain SHTV-5" /LENGTH=443 /DNA_ID=CAMNT_0050884227 /DNA_START=159 /DNA_END=1487 /DNA_ORIENTATION=-
MSRSVAAKLQHKLGAHKFGKSSAPEAEVLGGETPTGGGGGHHHSDSGQCVQLIGHGGGGSSNRSSGAAVGSSGTSGKSSSMSALKLPSSMKTKIAGSKAGKAASAFKKKLQGGGSPKHHSSKDPGADAKAAGDGAELLAIDDDGASWLEDSDSESSPFRWDKTPFDSSVVGYPDDDMTPAVAAAREGADPVDLLPRLWNRSGHSTPDTWRSRSPRPEAFEDAEYVDEELVSSEGGPGANGGASGSDHAAAPPLGEAGSDPEQGEAGVAAFLGGEAVSSSKSKGTASRARAALAAGLKKATGASRRAKAAPAAEHEGDEEEGRGGSTNGVAATILGAASGASSGSTSRPAKEAQLTWDSKRFAHVKPLQVSSIWDIPTSKDPNPEPSRKISNPFDSELDAPPRRPALGGKVVPKSKSFGSADLYPSEAAREDVWQPKSQSCTLA